MSAVVPPIAAPASSAAVNAAAASFAALVAKLDYLGTDGIDLVRRAYRFADQAHLARDCRRIAGLTPTALVAGLSDSFKTAAATLTTMEP